MKFATMMACLVKRNHRLGIVQCFFKIPIDPPHTFDGPIRRPFQSLSEPVEQRTEQRHEQQKTQGQLPIQIEESSQTRNRFERFANNTSPQLGHSGGQLLKRIGQIGQPV